MNLKHEASYFFTFFFKNFDGHLELFLCLSGETKIVPKGRFLFFPAKNTKIATNVHQNFKKKRKKIAGIVFLQLFLCFFFF